MVPIVGMCVAAAWPLVRYGEKERAEAVAIATLRTLQAAQERFRTAIGGYATDPASLLGGCPGSEPPPDTVISELHAAGYVWQLRPAVGVSPSGVDCDGRPIAGDYYVAVAPRTAWEAAGNAFASRADRQVYVFVDGVPPREADMASGLATRLEALESFDIP